MPPRGAAVVCFAEGVKTARGGGFVASGERGGERRLVSSTSGGRGGLRAENISCAYGPAAMNGWSGSVVRIVAPEH